MSEIKVNSIKGVAASSAAITVNNTDGTCTANITNKPNRNLIINGAMQVAQRGTSSTTNGYATVDRFFQGYSGTDEAPTQAQVDVASGTTPYTLGFRKALRITNGNQTSGAGASDVIQTVYKIEAQDIANSGWNYTSASSYITLSFWVKSSVAQEFHGFLLTNDGSAQLYSFSLGSLSADTWTKVTKTISGNSNLTFNSDNGEGLNLRITMFHGTARTGSITQNQWAAFNSNLRYPNYTSTWYTTNDATFEITGVQLEVSDHATDFEHRSFGQELKLCGRYYQKSYNYSTAPATATVTGAIVNTSYASSGFAGFSVQFETRMRADPTVTIYGTSTGTAGKMNADSVEGTGQASYIGEKNFFAHRQSDSTGVGNNVYMRCHFQADSEL